MLKKKLYNKRSLKKRKILYEKLNTWKIQEVNNNHNYENFKSNTDRNNILKSLQKNKNNNKKNRYKNQNKTIQENQESSKTSNDYYLTIFTPSSASSEISTSMSSFSSAKGCEGLDSSNGSSQIQHAFS